MIVNSDFRDPAKSGQVRGCRGVSVPFFVGPNHAKATNVRTLAEMFGTLFRPISLYPISLLVFTVKDES